MNSTAKALGKEAVVSRKRVLAESSQENLGLEYTHTHTHIYIRMYICEEVNRQSPVRVNVLWFFGLLSILIPDTNFSFSATLNTFALMKI